MPHISVAEYLSGEPLSHVKHEYIGGRVFAMAGASRDHNEAAGQCYAALRAHLRGHACRPFMSDMKVRLLLQQQEIFYYPDVVVGCDPRDTDDHSLRFPKVIIEVLSETTQRLDRLEKFTAYISIPTLEEYVLVAQDRAEVTVFRRRAGWAAEILSGMDAILVLESVDLHLPLRTIYENVRAVTGRAE